MTVYLTDPLLAPSRLTASQVRAWYVDNWGPVPTAVADYLAEAERLCTLVGFDLLLIVGQSLVETSDPDTLKPWTSYWWKTRLNPAGIGITGDDAQNNASQRWANGTDAARAQIVHMWAYVGQGVPPDCPIIDYSLDGIDKRYRAVYEADLERTVRTLGDLGNGRWAVATDYAELIAARANDLLRSIKEAPVPTSTELRVILNPGHRNTTGGNPEEAAFTPKLANAYFNAFSKSGYETVNLGDTNGGLDEACRRMAAQIASAPGPCVLFDLHLEGEGAPGVFAIVPDITGLHTNAAMPQDPIDTWENNAKDRELGNAIAVRIADATGLRVRTSGVRTPGLMDESQTGVGGEGFRLATFAYTSPYREKAVRLVVEHGCHTLEPDRSIIFSPGFSDKCAQAALQAVRMVYGGPSDPVPTPEPKPVPSVPWGRDATGPQDLNGRVALAFLGEVMAKRRVPIRYTATADGEIFATMQKGDKAIIRGSVRQPNGTRWALVEINGGVGRALLSAFSGPWPTT